ncbi:MAG: UDP-N-acetylmuramate--alanine ligase [Acidobacteria bacterium]|nr:UDP-N-acetylmuramate--alanine ligase [Acidobacteriota bacterium]
MGRWPAGWPASAYFVGVGGVAMSGLAILLARRGVRVRGSDASVYPPASDMLEAAGIPVATPYDAAHLEPPAEIVVLGNAISRGNPELERGLETGAPLVSLPEVIERLLVPDRVVTVVAGTHGKTTTTSILAHLHRAAGRDPSFLVGGLPGNFESGAWLGAGQDLLLEGDEYDTAFFDKGPKFLHYWPRIAVIGAVEFDHADIYADLAAVERSFALLVRMLPARGTLVVPAEDPVATRLAGSAPCRVVTFGSAPGARLRAVDRRDDEQGQSFRIERDGAPLGRVRLALAGEHNARNALAALLAAEAAGLPIEQAAPLLAGFRPPRRRLEVTGAGGGIVVYDDFAHHPTAIALTLATLRTLVPPGGRLVACFEPRSNTMVRRVLQAPLESALAAADVVYLGQVDRPERFAADQRMDVAAVVAALSARGIAAAGPLPPAAILERVSRDARGGDRIVVMSNGAFGGLARRLGEFASGRGRP